MKKVFTLFSCAACALVSGSLASAGSFNPEIQPLGSMSRSQSGMTLNQECVVGAPGAAMTKVAPLATKDYVEKNIVSKGGLIQSYGWLTSDRGPARAAAEVKINLAVAPVEGYEVNLYAVGIIDESTNSLAASIERDSETNVLPDFEDVELDTDDGFSVIASGELTKEGEKKAVAFYKDIEIVNGVINLNVDFNESTRKLAYQAYMGNGEDSPNISPGSTDAAITSHTVPSSLMPDSLRTSR